MGSISSAIGAAQRSLAAFSQSLAVIQNNIANASTPGYARQRVSLAPAFVPAGAAPQGVEVQAIETLRDSLLDFQVFRTRQQESQIEQEVRFFSIVEPNFRLDSEGGLGAALDGFFAAASQASVSPSDLNLRRAVLSSANGLASTFRGVYNNLAAQRNDLDTEARAAVSRINSLAEEVARLQGTAAGPAGSAVETRLNQVLDELSGLIPFTLQKQRSGTLSVIAAGNPIVTGNRTRPLQVTVTQGSLRILAADGRDVTATLEGEGGKLGGILKQRNQDLPALLGRINRLAKGVADRVNDQLQRGADLNGTPGKALFEYLSSAVTGAGRAAGTAGSATPSPPVSVDVTFTGGVSGSISAVLESFFVASSAPTAAAAGDTVSVRFTSADGLIERTVTTAPLLGSETAADLAARLNDQLALEPDLSGLVSFSVAGGNLKLTLSDGAGQGFSFTSSTSNPAFTTGLEAGGDLGGHSAGEIAAALNREIAADAALSAAGIAFTALNGEVKLDGDVAFDFSITDNDAAASGFASGLDGLSGTAGGALAAPALGIADLTPAELAVGSLLSPTGNGNILAVEALGEAPVLDGLSFSEFYGALVRDVGIAASSASSSLETQQQISLAALNLRDNFSAVDINEEAIALLQFEQGFSAMLRVIRMLDQLAGEILALVR